MKFKLIKEMKKIINGRKEFEVEREWVEIKIIDEKKNKWRLRKEYKKEKREMSRKIDWEKYLFNLENEEWMKKDIESEEEKKEERIWNVEGIKIKFIW